jgi:hypothetical protein
MCLNKKVIAGLAVTALGIHLFAPNVLAVALPLLIVAACPLSMLLMMRTMSGSSAERSCSSGKSASDAELDQLRSEVEALRAQRRASQAAAPLVPERN